MYLLLGNSHMGDGDYEGAIESFECARAQMRAHPSRGLLMVSLVRSLTAILQPIEIAYDL
jgi:hypothetical protein